MDKRHIRFLCRLPVFVRITDIVMPRDAKALADAIRTIAGDELAYRKFSAGAEKRYRDMFTKDKMINNVLDIYNKLWMK